MGTLTNLEAKVAPGAPGIEPRWTTGRKSGVGTAYGGGSAVWFTLSHGILNEVYYPFMDQANIRDMQLIVTGKDGYFCDEKRGMDHEVEWVETGVPAYRLTNTCKEGKCRIVKMIHTDPYRHSLVTSVHFEALEGKLEDYRLYVLLAPHVRNCGYGNDGWVDDVKGYPMLFAKRHGTGIALGCSHRFLARSVGYVGVSDGWTDLKENGELTALYTEAPNGNVALTGQIDLVGSGGKFRLVLGFGRGRAESSQQVRASLVADFRFVHDNYLWVWRELQESYKNLKTSSSALSEMYRISIAVLNTHSSKSRMGSMIASLSIPWGSSKGDNDLGGYHLVWPRDQVLSSLGFLAGGNGQSARFVLLWLMANQEEDGHWAQNLWDDGTPYWQAIQMDETALPILLADALHRHDVLGALDPSEMVKKAVCFLLRQGPLTEQDRWEENGGYTPFTLATEVAAVLAAADLYEREGLGREAEYLRTTADTWNDAIDRWLYAEGTELGKELGVEGYYIRVAPAELRDGWSPLGGEVPVRNRPPEEASIPAERMVSVDALALVRFGLRRADDPKILNTVKVIDTILKRETATGPTWLRYNQDGYGEKADGSAYDGTGVGRGWPLLAGERAHYEIAAGNFAEAERLAHVMVQQANKGGFIPEQVWDDADMPEKHLLNGRPTGGAMPLVWAHSEFIKVVRSLEDGKVFDMPPQTQKRYLEEGQTSDYLIWRFNQRFSWIPAGKHLRIQTNSRAKVRWTADGKSHEVEMEETGLSVYYVDLPCERLPKGAKISFSFYWTDVGAWEGEEFQLEVV